MRSRSLAVLLLTLVGVGLLGAPAAAGDGEPRRSGGRISVDGGLLVGSDERVEGMVVSIDGNVRIEGVVDGDMYVVHGDVTVPGRVRDDVLVIDGDVHVLGRVDGDIVVIGGRAIVTGLDTFVAGDIRSTDEPRIGRGAIVAGSIDKLGFGGLFSSLMFTLLAFLWLTVTVSGAILGTLFVWLFPRSAEAAASAGRKVGSTIVSGVVVGVLGPVVAVIAVASLVALPFGLVLAGALGVVAALGYVTTALVLGRTMVKGTARAARFGAFFAGFGILRAAAILPGIGALVGFAATVYGIGALVGAMLRASPEPAPMPPPSPSDSTSDEADAVDEAVDAESHVAEGTKDAATTE